MKIFATEPNDTSLRARYASASDFCRIFEDNMDHLYVLSLLLTADQDLAEKCFVGGLETARGSNAVFKEWAQSWARRTVITNAIRMISPRVEGAADGRSGDVKGLPPELAAVTRLKTFDRFVFVMSVLEGYSERDCRLMLDCSSSDIARARTGTLQQLAGLAAWYGNAPLAAIAGPTTKGGSPNDVVDRSARDGKKTSAIGLIQRFA